MQLGRPWLYILFLTIPVFITGITLIVRTAKSLAEKTHDAVVASVPVAAEQRVTFESAGEYALNIEGTRFSNDFLGLDYSLESGETGLAVPLRSVLFHTHVSGISRSRTELKSFELPAPGTYVLRVRGNRLASSDPNNRIVFARPLGGSVVSHVLALVALGILTIGSLVGSILVPVAVQGGLSSGISTGRPAPPGAQLPLEYQIAHSDAIIRARTTLTGAGARFQVLATWKGTLHPMTAGLGTAEGLYSEAQALERLGYGPVAGQEVIMLLLPLPGTETGGPPHNIMAQPLEILPIVDGKVVYPAFNSGVVRELTVEELQRLVTGGQAN